MRRFHTGLVADAYPIPTGFPYRGKGWTFCAVNHDPTGQQRSKRVATARNVVSKTILPKEIVVEAETEEAARRAHDLLWAAFLSCGTERFRLD